MKLLQVGTSGHQRGDGFQPCWEVGGLLSPFGCGVSQLVSFWHQENKARGLSWGRSRLHSHGYCKNRASRQVRGALPLTRDGRGGCPLDCGHLWNCSHAFLDVSRNRKSLPGHMRRSSIFLGPWFTPLYTEDSDAGCHLADSRVIVLPAPIVIIRNVYKCLVKTVRFFNL